MSESTISQGKLLLLLAVSGLIVSVSLNAFMWKQNSYIFNQRQQLTTQLAGVSKLQQDENGLAALLQDVANFSAQHPDVRTILTKYGYTVNVPAPAPTPVTPPATPATPPRKS